MVATDRNHVVYDRIQPTLERGREIRVPDMSTRECEAYFPISSYERLLAWMPPGEANETSEELREGRSVMLLKRNNMNVSTVDLISMSDDQHTEAPARARARILRATTLSTLF